VVTFVVTTFTSKVESSPMVVLVMDDPAVLEVASSSFACSCWTTDLVSTLGCGEATPSCAAAGAAPEGSVSLTAIIFLCRPFHTLGNGGAGAGATVLAPAASFA
jgi:hypothetical protein